MTQIATMPNETATASIDDDSPLGFEYENVSLAYPISRETGGPSSRPSGINSMTVTCLRCDGENCWWEAALGRVITVGCHNCRQKGTVTLDDLQGAGD